MADTVTVACLMEDLAVEERLDAAIDKCLKRLLFLKGLKSISASSSSAPPKRAGPLEAAVATFRRKIDVFGSTVNGLRPSKDRRAAGGHF
jgi:hypothetical protein